MAKSAKICPSCGAKAGSKKGIIIGVVIALVLISAVSANTNNENSGASTNTSSSESTVSSAASVESNAENTDSEETVSEEIVPEESKEEYISSCETYTYTEIARNPNDYVGLRAKFEGQVVQVMESGNQVTLRVDVTKEENQFADGGYIYSDTVYVEYTRKSDDESRILEDDIITMYGELNGVKTYTTILNSETTIPYLLAEYIDIDSI